MKSFFKEFLRDDAPAPGDIPQVCLGAFGKHPGWNDHMDDLGLETESLLAAKHLLYVQGIGGQLNSGAWEKLDETSRLPAIHHEFIWTRGTQVLAGRLWPSSDGKRRTLYPMAVCAHSFGCSGEFAVTQILPCLESIEAGCRATESAERVRAIVADGRRQLRAVLPADASMRIDQRSFASAEESIMTSMAAVIRDLRERLADFLRDKFRERNEPTAVGVRIASLADITADELILWNRFFTAFLDPGVPVLLVKPVNLPWIDVIAGEPAAPECFALRATPPAVPIAGDAAREIDESAREEAGRLRDAIIEPELVAVPTERPWLKRFFG